jgi:hypothetical protein
VRWRGNDENTVIREFAETLRRTWGMVVLTEGNTRIILVSGNLPIRIHGTEKLVADVVITSLEFTSGEDQMGIFKGILCPVRGAKNAKHVPGALEWTNLDNNHLLSLKCNMTVSVT